MNYVKQGDSLQLLDEVEDKSIQTIYFDPPFKSQKVYVMSPDDETGFPDVWSSNKEYMDFVEPLVIKCKSKLTDDGSFFFHISAKEMFLPEAICRKHFKLVQPIFWKRSRSKNNTKNKLGEAIDIIFWCSNNKKPKFNMVYQELDRYYAENSYKNKDSRGNYALGHIVYTKTQKTNNPDRLYQVVHDGVVYNPEHGWRMSKEDLEGLISEGRVHFPKNKGIRADSLEYGPQNKDVEDWWRKSPNPYKKIYQHESKGKPCMNLWDDVHSIAMGNEGRLYPTEKPEKLLERIILMTSDEGDIVLDPVAGSGTTGFVAKELGRDFIMFDINPDAVEIMKKRLYK